MAGWPGSSPRPTWPPTCPENPLFLKGSSVARFARSLKPLSKTWIENSRSFASLTRGEPRSRRSRPFLAVRIEVLTMFAPRAARADATSPQPHRTARALTRCARSPSIHRGTAPQPYSTAEALGRSLPTVARALALHPPSPRRSALPHRRTASAPPRAARATLPRLPCRVRWSRRCRAARHGAHRRPRFSRSAGRARGRRR